MLHNLDINRWRVAFWQERATKERIAEAHEALVERHQKLYAEFQRVLDENIRLAGEVASLRKDWRTIYNVETG